MTVEELMELKRKADAIAEIEKTVVKETNRQNFLLANLEKIFRFVKDTMEKTGVWYAKIPDLKGEYTTKYFGFDLENGVFSGYWGGDEPSKEINLEDLQTFLLDYDNRIKPHFVHLADHWATYKQLFLEDIEAQLKKRISNAQNNITSRTERYVTAKEFQV